MGANFIRKLPIPKCIKEEYPITDDLFLIKQSRDRQIRDIFEGKSDKLLLIIGPCSADNREAALEYIERLKCVADEVSEKLLIIPRIYTNKPRTSGDGYKGLLHQPMPTEKPDMLKGIIAVRELYLSALKYYGFTCANEMLYPDNHRYLSDILAYVAVGARSVENQQHRLTASGLDIPVGMKNPTSGDMGIMMNAVIAASHPHTFIYRGWEVESTGNPLAHSILRGYQNASHGYTENYRYDDLCRLYELYSQNSFLNPAVIVDTNHANSGKDPFKQPNIALDVLDSRAKSGDIKRMLKGFMIESYIEDGNQNINGGVFGKSITDACLGFDKSKELILKIADKI